MYNRECRTCGSHFIAKRKDKVFCNRACKVKNRQGFSYRRYKMDRCEFCGFVAVHPCQLDVDHIDGNRQNNEPDNLQTLCANCHRLKTHLNKDHLN